MKKWGKYAARHPQWTIVNRMPVGMANTKLPSA
jgi:hypothetical protein